ncbi:hypothetical protein QBC37DRAFT_412409 [Rhypophila decipiens]|uniref:Uncharacterized protein n=1 Tax=Rhypophila decipiens TaxID=261697 RepID=A0AAN7BC09_9PEZI|nr:hypothetical protein QBC37DRAFT_412409 [Rhypophila decipiens]
MLIAYLTTRKGQHTFEFESLAINPYTYLFDACALLVIFTHSSKVLHGWKVFPQWPTTNPLHTPFFYQVGCLHHRPQKPHLPHLATLFSMVLFLFVHALQTF